MWPELLARPHIARGARPGRRSPRRPTRPGPSPPASTDAVLGRGPGAVRRRRRRRHRPDDRRGHRPGAADRASWPPRPSPAPAPTGPALAQARYEAAVRPRARGRPPHVGCRSGGSCASELGRRGRGARRRPHALDPPQLRPLAVRGRAPRPSRSPRAAGTGGSSPARAPTRQQAVTTGRVAAGNTRLRPRRCGSPVRTQTRKPRPRTRDGRRRCGAGRIGATARPPHRHPPGGVAAPFAACPARCAHAHPTDRPPRDRAPRDARRHGRGLVPPPGRRRVARPAASAASAPRPWARPRWSRRWPRSAS